MVHGEQGHNKTGGAKSALGSMLVHHRLLYAVKFTAGLAKILNSQQLFAIEGGKKLDTGIHRLVADTIITEFTDNNRTGPAVTFRAAFLGSF